MGVKKFGGFWMCLEIVCHVWEGKENCGSDAEDDLKERYVSLSSVGARHETGSADSEKGSWK